MFPLLSLNYFSLYLIGKGSWPTCATPLTAQSLAAAEMVKVVARDRSDATAFKKGTLLVDRGNEDLVGSGVTSLSVPVDDSW